MEVSQGRYEVMQRVDESDSTGQNDRVHRNYGIFLKTGMKTINRGTIKKSRTDNSVVRCQSSKI